MSLSAPAPRSRGFVLFEAMLAVTIFSLAVLALGKCVDNCLRAELLIREEARVSRALANRMAEIEAGAEKVTDTKTEELKGIFSGIKLKESRTALKRQNEKEQEISGLYEITLTATWENRGAPQERALQFYVFSRQ